MCVVTGELLAATLSVCTYVPTYPLLPHRNPGDAKTERILMSENNTNESEESLLQQLIGPSQGRREQGIISE